MTDSTDETALRRLRTVEDLLACLGEAPALRYVEFAGDDEFMAFVVHATAPGASQVERWVAGVVLDSPAAELLHSARDASGHGAVEGGDRALWESLPVRHGPWCSTWTLPTHPGAKSSWESNWSNAA